MASSSEPSSALEAALALLARPDTYGGTAEVTVRETRTSFVFLAGELVYKLKKPISDPLLDFRTVDARERNAREEVRLNRRLAEPVYVGVAPLLRGAGGRLHLGRAGEETEEEPGKETGAAVDWLVVMRRLPQPAFLDEMIASGRATEEGARRLGGILAAFYRAEAPVILDPDEGPARLRQEIETARAALLDARLGADPARVRRIAEAALAGVHRHRGEVMERVRRGVLREGHGDLRPEHVSYIEPPVVIDCLEFSRRLRLVDPFDEVAYLGLECERLGAGWIGPLLIEALVAGFGQRPSDGLIRLYRGCRAFTRAHFALRHRLDPVPRQPEKWGPQAEAYFALAEAAMIGGSSRSTIDPPA